MKKQGELITMLTAYDYPSAKIAEMSGIDVILVGDSLGNVVQGNNTTLNVKLRDIIYHSKAVRNGAKDTFIIADMPYMTYHLDIKKTKANAAKIMTEAGVNAVKIEGGSDSRIEAIRAIIDCEVPVCGHLGLTPQSINILGDFKVQGKNPKDQEKLIEQALKIEKAGAFMLVLECIPEELGKTISERLTIPVIGIGAGRFTDGQVMVWHDILGMSDITPKFVKKYVDLKRVILEQVTLYIKDVKEKQFPERENVYIPIDKQEH
jgi:3-methyl-2-oxobutanoate hydroxymethyltransferase